MVAFKCDKCSKTYVNYKSLISHKGHHLRVGIKKIKKAEEILLLKDSNKKYVCEHCPLRFKSPKALRGHSNIHRPHKKEIANILLSLSGYVDI